MIVVDVKAYTLAENDNKIYATQSNPSILFPFAVFQNTTMGQLNTIAKCLVWLLTRVDSSPNKEIIMLISRKKSLHIIHQLI